MNGKKKAFTLIEMLVATILVAFVYTIITVNFKIQQTTLNNFKEQVESISLGQSAYNFINYIYKSRKIKLTKTYNEELINNIINENENTDIYLKHWFDNRLKLFLNSSGEIIPLNNIPDNSYYTITRETIGGESLFILKQINGPDDTDNMIKITSFDLTNLGEDRIGPYFYVKITKQDSGIVYNGENVYNLLFDIHFRYENSNKDYDFKFTLTP